ncbi:MAG: GNAT family N-acetyltransferase, partial [Verrucomicrobia bacterium]|nr:GNAT family N-acetyltransferase [Verrucomicrobiota bacterium]
MNGTEIRIVSAEPKQLAEVLDLISRFYREEGFATNRDQMEEPVERLLRGEGGAILLALSGSFPAGVAALATAVGIEQGGLGAELTDLYVHPDFRSHGIARKLIEQTIEWCRQHGV